MEDELVSIVSCLIAVQITLAVWGSREPPVGWFNTIPGNCVGDEVELPKSGATMVDCISGGWWTQIEEGKFDFTALDYQIDYATRKKLDLAIIAELGPFHATICAPWLRDKAKAAGEFGMGPMGTSGTMISTRSPILISEQEKLWKRVAERIREKDIEGAIKWVHPGAEWWFPFADRYNPLDIAGFRNWLAMRYGTIDKLNGVWESSFRSFEEITAPKVDTYGGGTGYELAKIMSIDFGDTHCSWSNSAASDAASIPGSVTYPAVIPGKTYTLSGWVKCENVRGLGAHLEIGWVGPNGGAPVAKSLSPYIIGTTGWKRLQATGVAPSNATRAWLFGFLDGTGTVLFDDLEFREAAGNENLVPNPGFEAGDSTPTGWSFQNWTNGDARSDYPRNEGRNGSRCVKIEVPLKSGDAGFRNPDAAISDWCKYWYEWAADYINSIGTLVKKHLPGIKTATYLTMSFAYPIEWDYSQSAAIAPDEVAMRSRDIDVLGLQVCSADGDPYRVTANLDLVRKYGKPVWAVDLVDFTSGIFIGAKVMERATQAAVQHGATGIVYCGWNVHVCHDYSFFPSLHLADLNRMLTNARMGIKLLDGMRVKARAAIVLPILPASHLDKDGFKNSPFSFLGWYKLLENSHWTVDVVTLNEIEKGARLSGYDWVLIPDCAFISNAALKRLTDYTKGGGRLVSCGRFAELDEKRRPLRETLPKVTKMPDYGAAYCGRLYRDRHYGNTPPLFLWRKDTSATRAAARDAHKALSQLKLCRGFAMVPACESVRMVEYAGAKGNAAYLVNFGAKAASGLRLETPYSGRVEVYADMKPATTAVNRRGRCTVIALPKFTTSCIVRVLSGPTSRARART